MSTRRRLVRTTVALAVLGMAGLATATAAAAHVTVQSPGATQGGYAVLTFRVPTESATASTTGIKVQLPTDHPIASVSVQPLTGWTYQVTKAKLTTPITTDDGTLTEAVSEIDWTATSPDYAIKPGEFDQFNISAGPLPKVDSLTFKTIQLYSDGTQVAWTEVPAAGSTAEPDHPAPTLTLAAATGATPTPGDGSSEATGATGASKGAATTGIVLGAIGVVLGGAALTLVLLRQRGSSGA